MAIRPKRALVSVSRNRLANYISTVQPSAIDRDKDGVLLCKKTEEAQLERLYALVSLLTGMIPMLCGLLHWRGPTSALSV